jgi:hypothetical protein
MCPVPDPDSEYWLFKRQLRQVEKWCCDNRYGENADDGVLRDQLGVLEGWMREVGVVIGPWQRDAGTTCRRSVRSAGRCRVIRMYGRGVTKWLSLCCIERAYHIR